MTWDHRFWCELLKVRIIEVRIIKVPLYMKLANSNCDNSKIVVLQS